MGAAADLQTHLAAQALVDGATGWPSSRGQLHDGSDQLVLISEAGGPAPRTRTGEEFHSVQVRARGGVGDADAPRDKLRAIRDAIQAQLNITLGATTYIEVMAENEIVPMGYDDKGRPEFAQTFSLQR